MLVITLVELITLDFAAFPVFLRVHRQICEIPVKKNNRDTVRR